MTRATEQRRKRFVEALAVAQMTQSRWAHENGVTRSHLSHVLAGRESQSLTDKIDAFIADTLGKRTTALAS